MMDAQKTDDLAMLFRLMKRIDALATLNKFFKAYVTVRQRFVSSRLCA